MYDIKSQKILGSFDPIDGLWSIPYEFDSDDINVLNHRGRLYIVVDFEASSNIDLHLASKIIIDQIKEKYYGDMDGTPLQAIEKALIAGKDKLREIAKGDETVVKSLKFNIACSVVWGKVLYVAQLGESAVLLIRNGDILDIGHKTSGEVLTSSGILESGDVFILATKHFNDSFNNSLLLEKLGSLEEEFKKSESPAALSAVVVMFKKSMLPGKRDIVGIVSSLSKSQDSNKINIDTSRPLDNPSLNINSLEESLDSDLENDIELSSITTLTDIPSIANKDTGVSSVLVQDREHKRHIKKPNKKTLATYGLILLLTGVVFSSYQFYLKDKFFGRTENDISLVDISELNTRFENLQNLKGSKNDFVALLSSLNKEIESGNQDSSLQELKIKVENTIATFDLDNTDKDSSLFNFNVKSGSSKISNLALFGDKILVSDLGAGNSYLFTDLEQPEITDFAKQGDYLTSIAGDKNFYVLTSNAFYVGERPNDLQKFALDSELTDFVDAVEYSGNLYVLTKDTIYKYAETASTFTGSVWSTVDAGYTALTIDGSIFLAGSKGIVEYYTGEKQEFSSAILGAKDIYTTRDLDYLWVLLDKKIVKVDKKTGEELFAQNLEMVVDHFTVIKDTIYASSGSKLHKIPVENK